MRFPSPVSSVSRTVILLIACALSGCASGEKDAAPGHPLTVTAVAPKGQTAPPLVFRWRISPGEREASGGEPARVYRLTVYDAAERQLLERETRETRLDATEDLLPLVPSTPRMLWRVEVIGEKGEVTAQTPPAEFTVRVDGR